MMYMPMGNKHRSEKYVRLYRKIERVLSSFCKQAIDIISVPENFFLVFAGFFGLLFVFLIPPMQSPDEHSHLYRSYQTSSLGIFAEPFEEDGRVRYGTRLPQSMYAAGEQLRNPTAGNPSIPFNTDLYQEFLTKPLDEDNTLIVKSEAVNVYSPVVYIPQAIGFGVGRIIDASPLIMIWLGRLANLAFWLTIVFFAIRLFPIAKWGLVVLALNPVTISISASLSGDVMSIGSAFLFVSIVFSTRSSTVKQVGHKLILLLGILVLILCLSKPVNIFLLPLLLIIPAVKLGGIKKKILIIGAITLIALFVGALWNLSTKDILDLAVQDQRPGYGVSPSEQLKYIFTHPVDYAITALRNFVIVDGGSSANAVLNTYLGVFGWLDTSIPLWTQLLYFAGLMFAILYQFGRGVAFSWKAKALFLLVFVMAYGAAITAMYMNYTPVGARIFEGVQGRYFMPASIVLLGLFTSKKKLVVNNDKVIPLVLLAIMSVVLFMSALKIFARYY